MRTFSMLSVSRSLALPLILSATSLAAAALSAPQNHQANPAQGVSLRATYGQPAILNLSQSDAFAILGHSCGGITEHPYVTGFDPASGLPKGAVYLSTTCSAGGHGGNTITYTAWAGVTWDFGAQVVTATTLSSPPSVDPNFIATDLFEDVIYNAGSTAYLLVPFPGAPAGVTAVQSGDEFHVAWIPRLVNPIAITSTTLTATPVNSSAPILTTTVTGSAASGIIPTLQPQTTYLITVVSTTLSGPGPASYPLSVTTSPPTQPPGAPTGVSATWTNQNPSGPTDTFIVTWNAADPGDSPIDQYQIQATDLDHGTSVTQTVSGTTLTASFTEDWVPDWSIKVKAHNAFGWGPWSSAYTLGGL